MSDISHPPMPEGLPELQRGDLVEILLGPALGRVGLINEIQDDHTKTEGSEVRGLRIGVGLVEAIEVHPVLMEILVKGNLLRADVVRQEVTRWFNDFSDLRLLFRGSSNPDSL